MCDRCCVERRVISMLLDRLSLLDGDLDFAGEDSELLMEAFRRCDMREGFVSDFGDLIDSGTHEVSGRLQ